MNEGKGLTGHEKRKTRAWNTAERKRQASRLQRDLEQIQVSIARFEVMTDEEWNSIPIYTKIERTAFLEQLRNKEQKLLKKIGRSSEKPPVSQTIESVGSQKDLDAVVGGWIELLDSEKSITEIDQNSPEYQTLGEKIMRLRDTLGLTSDR